MNKTQAAIMAEATGRGRIGLEYAYGRGPAGGKVATGLRTWKAAHALVALGKLERRHWEKTAIGNHGYTTWIVSAIFYPAA